MAFIEFYRKCKAKKCGNYVEELSRLFIEFSDKLLESGGVKIFATQVHAPVPQSFRFIGHFVFGSHRTYETHTLSEIL